MTRHGLFVLGFLLALLSAEPILAQMPPHPALVKRIQDGELSPPYTIQNMADVRARGVDNAWSTHDLGVRKESGFARSLGPSLAPVGSWRILVLLVRFSDKPSQTAAQNFDGLLFSTSGGTLRDYFSKISFGSLDIVTVNLPGSLGWYTAPQTYAYYCNAQNGLGAYPRNAQRLVEDLVTATNPVIDYSLYDNDGDGFVDALFVAHAGVGAEYSGSNNDIWSHSWSTSYALNVDGVMVRRYSMEPEYWANPGDMTIGVFAHEFAHAGFGVPDLYDRDNTSRGVGDWSLMASGSWNGVNGNLPAFPDAWTHIQMGYVAPSIVATNLIQHPIPNAETSPTAFLLWTNGEVGEEYFLVQNRQKTGYDGDLPGSGLLIYHVDETVNTQNDKEWYPGHTTSGHYLVSVIQADNQWHLEKRANPGDTGDPYPGSTGNVAFDGQSSPNSNSYFFAPTSVAVRNISGSQLVMTADLHVNEQGSTIAWQVPLQVADNGSGLQTLTIGQAASATSGLDPGLGESELPPPPPVGVFDARLIFPVNPPIASLVDMRDSVLTAVSWIVTFQPGANGYPITLTWPHLTLPSGSFQLRDAIDGSIVNVNMKTTGSYTLTNTGITSLLIERSTSLCAPVAVNSAWNLLSVPVEAANMNATSLFPGVIVPLYGFSNGYSVESILSPGRGYWAKFNAGTSFTICGNPVTPRDVPVAAGWNIMGPYDVNTAAASVTSTPSGIVLTPFYGYDNGYLIATTLVVGKGYWVKVSQAGTLHLQPNTSPPAAKLLTPEISPKWGRLEISDNLGNRGVLYLIGDTPDPGSAYDLPPVPPSGIFDVRFSGDRSVRRIGSGAMQVLLSSAAPPLTMCASNLNGKVFALRDAAGRNLAGGILREGNPLTIPSSLCSFSIAAIGTESTPPGRYSLGQNYPNPFNPTTTIAFDIPVSTSVKITLFTILGERVADLTNQIYGAGYHYITIDASDLSSGTYLYKMEAGSFVAVKKLLVLK